ncbi:MAG TPA: preprotein translocase subunit SecE [Actinomycetota bacterium]|nr:preprotein translocase subunit SecE [Actinomycetota bacterium]
MNRETKRAMDKAERSKDKLTRPTPQQVAAKRKRTGMRQFAKEVRGELARVAWPNRQEVVTYTVVVLVSVAFFMTVIGGLDYGFTKLVVKVISGA